MVRLLLAAKDFILSSDAIEILEQSDTQLVLASGRREIVVNKRFGTVKSGQRVLARFADIRAIEIQRRRDDDGPDTWSVSLALSWWSSVHVGRTEDATEASIVAARLSTITGKKVVALT